MRQSRWSFVPWQSYGTSFVICSKGLQPLALFSRLTLNRLEVFMMTVTETMPNEAIASLTPRELSECDPAPLLVDVRSAVEFRSGHAPGARNLSLLRIVMGVGFGWRWLLPDWFKGQKREEAIALICLTAHRSPIAAQQLQRAGFQQVINIAGGMMSWQKAGLPTVKGAANP
jgi:rhodanese-related sulfurtransferase